MRAVSGPRPQDAPAATAAANDGQLVYQRCEAAGEAASRDHARPATQGLLDPGE